MQAELMERKRELRQEKEDLTNRRMPALIEALSVELIKVIETEVEKAKAEVGLLGQEKKVESAPLDADKLLSTLREVIEKHLGEEEGQREEYLVYEGGTFMIKKERKAKVTLRAARQMELQLRQIINNFTE